MCREFANCFEIAVRVRLDGSGVHFFTLFVCSRVHRMQQYVVFHFWTIAMRRARRVPEMSLLIQCAQRAALCHCLLFCAILLVDSITDRCVKCLTWCKVIGVRLLGTLLQDFCYLRVLSEALLLNTLSFLLGGFYRVCQKLPVQHPVRCFCAIFVRIDSSHSSFTKFCVLLRKLTRFREA